MGNKSSYTHLYTFSRLTFCLSYDQAHHETLCIASEAFVACNCIYISHNIHVVIHKTLLTTRSCQATSLIRLGGGGLVTKLMYNDTCLYMYNVGNVFLENLELKENALVCLQ